MGLMVPSKHSSQPIQLMTWPDCGLPSAAPAAPCYLPAAGLLCKAGAPGTACLQ